MRLLTELQFCPTSSSRCYKRETRKKTTISCGLFAVLKLFSVNILCLAFKKRYALI